jgi:hypothetical protein
MALTFAGVLAAVSASPALAADSAADPAGCQPGAGKGCATAGPLQESTRSGGATVNVYPVAPPAIFDRNTPCFREEATSQISTTSDNQLAYELFIGGSVCLPGGQIVLYDVTTEVYYPNEVRDPRLVTVFAIRNEIANFSPLHKTAYSELRVSYCEAPTQCQNYWHRIGLEFTDAFVVPFSFFERFA